MCNTNPSTLLPYGLKIPTPTPYFPFSPTGVTHLPGLDFQRSQLCDYGARLQYGFRGYPSPLGLSPYHGHLADPYTQAYLYKHDLRARYIQEEPKPSHSYIGLIAMAILSHKDKKLVLSDIYQWILDNYAYFRTRGPGWRNSIRHNLSLNDCFIKAGRSANGKGHYWAVHPANIDDFQRGDFRRRRAQRKVRKHMGLAVPDDEDSPSPSPTPQATWDEKEEDAEGGPKSPAQDMRDGSFEVEEGAERPQVPPVPIVVQPVKKRLFDVESLLAPEIKPVPHPPVLPKPAHHPNHESDAHIDIVSDGEALDICNTDSEDQGVGESCDGATSLRRETSSAPATSTSPPPSPCRSIEESDKTPSPDSVSKRPEGLPWPMSTLGRSRQSAFHATSAAGWDTYTTYIYPMFSSTYPVVLPGSSLSPEAASKWREAVYGLGSAPAGKTSEVDRR
ncbi:forkhead box C1-A-like [Haliotis asinina]|uniref:forkhead box C1-A-like n=1 Tax=Haliotis asinina TaxID=109174 RepID=UPI0035326E97